MIYYGILDDKAVRNAVLYDVAILHPSSGNLTRDVVARIQRAGTRVFGYLSIGEDLRTAGISGQAMRNDSRFTGDGSGPRVDPRADKAAPLPSADSPDGAGLPSPGGTGFASYYLDDNDRDGLPDRNPFFGCAYTRIGDPAWFDVLDDMTLDGEDGAAGIREILTPDYGRGLDCDGIFLDTLDTCAPNAYTEDDNPARTRFEWTAAGASAFLDRLRQRYPGKLICQNRGLFFFDPRLPHYRFCTRHYIDFLLFESYRLDASPKQLYHEGYAADNRYAVAPKLLAEAARPDGFTVLSLGYAEGPPALKLRETLAGQSEEGLAALYTDIAEAEAMGFSHYLTDSGLTLLNDFVLRHSAIPFPAPPVWSSVYNDSPTWPPRAPSPRVGIGEAVRIDGDAVAVRWDVALSPCGVVYTLYYSDAPPDFSLDPELSAAKRLTLVPEPGDTYGQQEDAYPYCAVVRGFSRGKRYWFVIRAKTARGEHSEEHNTVFRTVEIPYPSKKSQRSCKTVEQPTILRQTAEEAYANEIQALIAAETDPVPTGWQMSPRSVLTYILGGTKVKGVDISPKYIGNRRLVEIAIATLVTDRALLLIGEPGTAKSWLSEHLAAAINGDSTKTVQGTAGTTEEQIRYSWNYAMLIANGPSAEAMVKSPIYRAMETGTLARVEEISRCASEVQDALISILSEKRISVPELGLEVPARRGFSLIATANTRDKGVNEMSAALKRRFNIVVLPTPSDMETEIDIVRTRVAQMSSGMTLHAALPDEDTVAKIVTIFRELRAGETLDGKQKVKTTSGVLSTAEAISLLANSMALAGSFGSGAITADDLAAGLQGAVVKDDDKDKIAWKEYLENVMKKRGSQWLPLYRACKELES